MKKIIILLISIMLVLSMVLTFSGCNTEEAAQEEETAAEVATEEETAAEEETTEAEAEEEEAPAEEITLNFWHPFTDDRAAIVQTTVDNFMAANPGVTIDVLPIENSIYGSEKLPLALGSDDPPDIFFQWAGIGNKVYIDQGFYLDVDQALREVADELIPGVFNSWTFYDKVYGATHTSVSHMMLYNKEIFDQYGLGVPKTWEEFINVCETLKTNGVTPIAFGIQDVWNASHWVSYFYASLAGNEFVADSLAEPDKLDNIAYIEALQTFKDLAVNGYLLPDALAYTDADVHALFYNGETAMYWPGTWNYPEVLGALGDPVNGFSSFEYDTFPLPGPKENMIYADANAICGHSKTEFPEVVRDFLVYWISYENALYFIEESLEPINTNLKALNDSKDKLDFLTVATMEVFEDPEWETYDSMHVYFQTMDYWQGFQEEFQSLLFSDQTAEETAKIQNEGYANAIK